jgi:hypothetical protein
MVRQLVRQSDNNGAAPTWAGLWPNSALVVGRQRPEVALELLGVESLLAMTGEDRLDGGVASSAAKAALGGYTDFTLVPDYPQVT